MMESVRHKTEGTSAAAAPVEAKSSAMPDQAALDAMLMKKADQASSILKDMANFQDPTVKKAVKEQTELEKKLSEVVPVSKYQASHSESSGSQDLEPIDMDDDDDASAEE